MTHKPGWQTSEFWVTVFAILALFVTSFASTLPEKWAAVASSIAIAAYSVSRGLAKLFTPPNTNPDLKE